MKKRGFFILTILAIFLISSIQANIYSEEGIYGTPLEEEVTGAITDTNATTECAGDEVLLGNGSCQSSADFGGGNPFDQSLNTTNDVSFNVLNTTNKFHSDASTNYTYFDFGADIGICWNSTHIIWGESITGQCG